MKFHITELKINWISKVRIKYTPFIQSNNDLIYFFIIAIYTIGTLFGDSWLSIKIRDVLAIFLSMYLYITAKSHKIIMSVLFPIWGFIFLYQILLKSHANILDTKQLILLISTALMPYLLTALVNTFKPKLQFNLKAMIFIGFCVATLVLKNLTDRILA